MYNGFDLSSIYNHWSETSKHEKFLNGRESHALQVHEALKAVGTPGKETKFETNTTNTPFSKTKLCSFHLRGKCTHGAHCLYAHDVSELKSPPDLTKTRLCPMLRKGMCMKKQCTYAHTREDLRGTADVYKTSICRFYANGKCSAGKHCRHAHGVSELRNRQSTPPSLLLDHDSCSVSPLLTPPPGFCGYFH